MRNFFKRIFSALDFTKEASKHKLLTRNEYEYDRAVRRIILLYVSIVWLWLIQVAVRMYIDTLTIDDNYTNLCIAVTTMLGACYAFYFTDKTSYVPPAPDNFPEN